MEKSLAWESGRLLGVVSGHCRSMPWVVTVSHFPDARHQAASEGGREMTVLDPIPEAWCHQGSPAEDITDTLPSSDSAQHSDFIKFQDETLQFAAPHGTFSLQGSHRAPGSPAQHVLPSVTETSAVLGVSLDLAKVFSSTWSWGGFDRVGKTGMVPLRCG